MLYSHCLSCGYDLTGTIAADEWRCPECGVPFTAEQLRDASSDHEGAPASTSPHEWRVQGRTVVIAVFVLALAVLGLVILTDWLL